MPHYIAILYDLQKVKKLPILFSIALTAIIGAIYLGMPSVLIEGMKLSIETGDFYPFTRLLKTISQWSLSLWPEFLVCFSLIFLMTLGIKAAKMLKGRSSQMTQ